VLPNLPQRTRMGHPQRWENAQKTGLATRRGMRPVPLARHEPRRASFTMLRENAYDELLSGVDGMRRVLVLALSAAVSALASAPKQPPSPELTVAQLEQFISASQGVKDKKLAKQIYDLKLTERLSDANLALLAKELPGPQSLEALTAIADESAFLKLPATEIPSRPAPSADEQSAISARTLDYLTKAVHKLPDFYAARSTTAYVGTTTVIPPGAYDAIFGFWGLHHDQRLVPAVKSSVTVLFRDGQDTYADEKERVTAECNANGPTGISTGQFGQLLALLPQIIARNGLTWDHWEQDGAGFLAVFRYSAFLLFQDELNCPVEERIPPGPYEYKGEIAIRPEDGTVLRITRTSQLMLDLFGYGPEMSEVDTMVKYGPVEIGQFFYICPVKSVHVSLGPALDIFSWTRPPKQRTEFDRRFGLAKDPIWEDVDDVVFEQYHVFRAETKILPGFNNAPGPPVSPSQPGNQPTPPR